MNEQTYNELKTFYKKKKASCNLTGKRLEGYEQALNAFMSKINDIYRRENI